MTPDPHSLTEELFSTPFPEDVTWEDVRPADVSLCDPGGLFGGVWEECVLVKYPLQRPHWESEKRNSMREGQKEVRLHAIP